MPVVSSLRQPEYTGENRCIPCTVVNVCIALVVSVLAALVSPFLGVGVLVLSLVVIYLHGYLVPGTPTITERYFPDRVLRWFDKGSAAPVNDGPIDVDPERILLDADAVEPCREGTDLCLTSEFRRAWRDRIHTVRPRDIDADQLVEALGASTDHDRIEIHRQGEALIAYADNAVIGQWGSQAAIVADVAAAPVLDERVPHWSHLAPAEVVRVLMSLRLFIEQCPECDGPVRVDQEVVDSCCRSYDVVASTCQNCGDRLFEMEWDDAVADGLQG